MPYSNFKSLDDLKQQFGISISSSGSLFKTAKEVLVCEQLLSILEENVPLALNINTEKARSELIIAPVLVEVRKLLERKISLFSGIDFSVDETLGLSGYCDFILSYSSDQVFLEMPVVCIVEAKNENIKTGYIQCVAEMLAAKLFNERNLRPTNYVLGVVTTGSNWKFLKLAETKVLIDFDEYLISQINKILGIFVEAVQGLSNGIYSVQN
jgi:hypothetical protein